MRRALTDKEIRRLREWVEAQWISSPKPVRHLYEDEAVEYVRSHLAGTMPSLPLNLEARVLAFLAEGQTPPAAYDVAADFASEGVRLRGRTGGAKGPEPTPRPAEAAPVAEPEPVVAAPVVAPEPVVAAPASSPAPARRRPGGRMLTYHERFSLRVALWELLGGPDACLFPPDDPTMTEESVDSYIAALARSRRKSIAPGQVPWRPSRPEGAPTARDAGLQRFRSRTELAEERRQRRERHRQQREEEVTRRTDALHRLLPRLGEVQLELQVLVREMVRALVSRQATQAEFEERRRRLMAEKQSLLIHYKIDEDAFLVQYDCPHCKDTGWLEPVPVRPVDPQDPHQYPPVYYPPEKCSCLKREEIEDIFKAAGLQGPQKGWTFGSFRLDIYPPQTRPQVEAVVRHCQAFAESVIYGEEASSLVIEGTAGGGKTHLACAIAHECIAAKRVVVYSTMTDFIEIARMRTLELNEENRAFLQQVLNADLLIIDDLGAERITEYSAVELTNALNHRLNNALPMVITTNLTRNDIKEYYGDRIYSRLVNGCDVLTLEPGIDVREALRRR